jgi:hypothetical protein
MEIHAVSTWIDQHHGVVRVEDDVANVVRDIHAISSRIHVFFNEQTGNFDLVESCLDNTDRLIFSVEHLDARVVNRLRLADQWQGREDPAHMLSEDEDFLSMMDADQAADKAAQKERHMDGVRDAGERLAWALEQDRRGVKASISIPKELDG